MAAPVSSQTLLAALGPVLAAVLAAGGALGAGSGSRLSRSVFILLAGVLALHMVRYALLDRQHVETLAHVAVAWLLPAILLEGGRRFASADRAAVLAALRDFSLVITVAAGIAVVNGLGLRLADHALLYNGVALSGWLLLAHLLQQLLRPSSRAGVASLPGLLPLLPAGWYAFVVLFGPANPVFSGEDMGLLPLCNALAAAYALPALMLARMAAARAGPARRWLTACAAGFALVWLALEIRHSFHGAILSGPTRPLELAVTILALAAVGALFLFVASRRRL